MRRSFRRKISKFKNLWASTVHIGVDRPIPVVQHRSTESVASCEMVRFMTHEEFAAKHPHPPKPFHVNINRKSEQTADRQRELTADQQPTLVLDRRAPLCYLVQLTKINLARLYALRNPSQPSETPTDNISEQSKDAPEPMQVDHATVGRTFRKRFPSLWREELIMIRRWRVSERGF